MADMISINKYKNGRLSHEQVREMYEQKRQEFYDTYGKEPRPGESENIKHWRETFNIDNSLVSKAIVRNLYGLSDENTTPFEERRQEAELLKMIENMKDLKKDEEETKKISGFDTSEMIDKRLK